MGAPDDALEVDEATVGDLRSLDEDGATLADLFERYAVDTERLVGLIAAAAERGDASGVAEAAHALKGSSATFGAAGLARLAGRLEDEARAGSVSRASAVVDAAPLAIAALRAAVERARRAPGA